VNRVWTNRLLQAAIAVLPLAGLFWMKWSRSARTVAQTLASGQLAPRSGPLALDALGWAGRPLVETANYLAIVWQALAVSVVLAAAVRTLVSPVRLVRLLGDRGTVREQIAAGLLGTPLMLCSCCIAPVFTTVYGRSRRLGPSLGIMLASPALNPASLILTFALFSRGTALARLGMAVVAVFVATALVGRAFRGDPGSGGEAASNPVDGVLDSPGATLRAFGRSVGHVAARTLPLVLIGVVASVVLARAVPLGALAGHAGRAVSVALVALVAVPLALPTFFEIPLALALLAAGAPAGAAAALLFAGPAINLPSLLTVARTSSWRVAAALAATVWVIALIGGLVVP
jgi:uncharacterized protein